MGIYGATLLPGLGVGDTAEFQRVAPGLELAHSTGYPLYSLLGWLWSKLIPFGIPAWRMNLFSAVGAVAMLLLLLALLRQMGLAVWAALIAVAAFGLLLPVWYQATQAEIYAFALLLLVLNLWLVWRWNTGALSFWWIGLGVGLALVHHRTSLLWLPGLVGWALWTRWPGWRALGQALPGCSAVLLLYIYVPWRAPVWEDRWALLWAYVLGSSGGDWFDFGRLLEAGWRRPWEIWWELVVQPWSWPILVLSLVGLGIAWRRMRSFTVALGSAYGATWLFCAAYFVADLHVFVLPLHLFHAIWLAVGLDALGRWLPGRWLTGAALAIPLLLGVRGWPLIQAAHNSVDEQIARTRLAQPLPQQALIVGDGVELEPLRYLQTIEQQRPDLEWSFTVEPARIIQVLEQGRAVFLLEPHPTLPLRQEPFYGFWQVHDAAPTIDTQLDVIWGERLHLSGMSLPQQALKRGDTMLVSLSWQALETMEQEYLRFVHLIGPDGQLWSQADQPPAGLSTQQWPTHTPSYDLVALRVPPDAPPGRYTLVLGLYSYPGLEPWLITHPEQAERWELGSIEVIE